MKKLRLIDKAVMYMHRQWIPSQPNTSTVQAAILRAYQAGYTRCHKDSQ